MSDVGLVHTSAAAVALGAGAAVVLTRKGTRLHRQLGHLYVWSMVGVIGTSFLLRGLTGGLGPFHALALISLVTLAAGAGPALTRRPRRSWLEYHSRFMAWSYAGLVAAAGAEVVARVPGVPFAPGVVLVTAGVTGFAAVLIHGDGEARIRGAVRRARRGSPSGVAGVLAVAVATGAGAQEPGAGVPALDRLVVELDRAVIEGALDQVRSVRARLEGASSPAGAEGLRLHYLGYALSREAELVQAARRDERRELRHGARAALERSAAQLALGETHALLAMLIGLEIEDRPWKAIFLGGRWRSELRKAREAGPSNPRVLLLSAVAAYHAPAAHGGGLERAEAELEAALAAFAADTARPPHPTWGHAEAYVWLGRLRERQARWVEARAAYGRALELEPGLAWARARLAGLPPSD